MKARMVNDGNGGKKIGKITDAQATSMLKESNLQHAAKSVIDAAIKLSAQREAFEAEEFARSNKALYAILSNVYALFNKAVADNCIREVAKAMRAELKQRGIRVQSNTPALTCFVRFVFNSDRKRAYNYATTLMAAVNAGIAPTALSEFIELGNGVEECKKKFKMKEEVRQRNEAVRALSLDIVDTLQTMQPSATVTLPNAAVTLADGAQFAFIVARSIGNGKFELLHAVPTTTKVMQSCAVKELAKYSIATAELANAAAKAKRVKNSTQQAAASITAKTAANMTLGELEAA
jgi:hypothetical protein